MEPAGGPKLKAKRVLTGFCPGGVTGVKEPTLDLECLRVSLVPLRGLLLLCCCCSLLRACRLELRWPAAAKWRAAGRSLGEGLAGKGSPFH